MGKIFLVDLKRNLIWTWRRAFCDFDSLTLGIKVSGLWNIKAVTSTDPFKLVPMNLKNGRVSLKMQVCKPNRCISMMNSLNSTDLLLSTFSMVIVPDTFKPRAISESAGKTNKLLEAFAKLNLKLYRLPFPISFDSREFRSRLKTAKIEQRLQKTWETKSLFTLHCLQRFSIELLSCFWEKSSVFILYPIQRSVKSMKNEHRNWYKIAQDKWKNKSNLKQQSINFELKLSNQTWNIQNCTKKIAHNQSFGLEVSKYFPFRNS